MQAPKQTFVCPASFAGRCLRWVAALGVIMGLTLSPTLGTAQHSGVIWGQFGIWDDAPWPETANVLLNGVHITRTDPDGHFWITAAAGQHSLTVFLPGFELINLSVTVDAGDTTLVRGTLRELASEIDSVEITEQLSAAMGYTRLKSIEGQCIYAAKKNEVIIPAELNVNLATNNARQVFARVSGLNIWESDGYGLQLGIGGRGLSPHRTSNFNTRQNGYDISADNYGYPDVYYTPPMEALARIEVIRGAASLQYGTQFGGLLNFVLHRGPEDRKLETTLRQSVGSWGFSNTFLSLGGTSGKVNYYGYLQHKRGDGWRPNSGFWNNSGHFNLHWKLAPRLTMGTEYTYFAYQAQQAGGLTDAQFQADPQQSQRSRNWFNVNWHLSSTYLEFKANERFSIQSRFFALAGGREALGFLGPTHRVDLWQQRDLVSDRYLNLGNETRALWRYSIGDRMAALAFGTRLYQGCTRKRQGLANAGSGPDFLFLNPETLEGSDYDFPSQNAAVFAENVFFLSEKLSITPGIRWEWLRTASEGYYTVRYTNFVGEVVYQDQITESRQRSRGVFLAGLGLSYRPLRQMEVYANFSQNYRAVNFNDIRVLNPNFRVDPQIQDERGFNGDLGIRGEVRDWITYDFTAFCLLYRDRIGQVLLADPQTNQVYSYRTNIADSWTAGVETFTELNLIRPFRKNAKWQPSIFANAAVMDARYYNTDEAAFQNRRVELVPQVNLKTGANLRWRDFRIGFQYTYISSQYTEATNAERTPSAIDGLIPSYWVMDLSMAYTWRWLTAETSLNNLTDRMYFTRRAAGYPGPGIIPSDGRAVYFTLQARF